jgi:hypothetical protein
LIGAGCCISVSLCVVQLAVPAAFFSIMYDLTRPSQSDRYTRFVD